MKPKAKFYHRTLTNSELTHGPVVDFVFGSGDEDLAKLCDSSGKINLQADKVLILVGGSKSIVELLAAPKYGNVRVLAKSRLCVLVTQITKSKLSKKKTVVQLADSALAKSGFGHPADLGMTELAKAVSMEMSGTIGSDPKRLYSKVKMSEQEYYNSPSDG